MTRTAKLLRHYAYHVRRPIRTVIRLLITNHVREFLFLIFINNETAKVQSSKLNINKPTFRDRYHGEVLNTTVRLVDSCIVSCLQVIHSPVNI